MLLDTGQAHGGQPPLPDRSPVEPVQGRRRDALTLTSHASQWPTPYGRRSSATCRLGPGFRSPSNPPASRPTRSPSARTDTGSTSAENPPGRRWPAVPHRPLRAVARPAKAEDDRGRRVQNPITVCRIGGSDRRARRETSSRNSSRVAREAVRRPTASKFWSMPHRCGPEADGTVKSGYVVETRLSRES